MTAITLTATAVAFIAAFVLGVVFGLGLCAALAKIDLGKFD